MRYYTLIITDPTSGKVVRQFSSQKADGSNDPGALQVEFDLPIAPYAQPFGSAYIRIYGVGLNEISQSADFNFKSIAVYGGMATGLPLANPRQAGLLMSGTIQQAFGNWVGTAMTLDFLITAGTIAGTAAVNLTLNWRKGVAMAVAIANTLKTVFPSYAYSVNISPNLVLDHDEPGFYGNLIQFSQYVKQASISILGQSYQGVDVLLKEKTFIVYDGTSKATPKQVQFNDLVGQPTWIAANTIQLTTIMRADLSVSDYIKLPPGQIVTTAQSYSQYKQGSVFQGTYQIASLRHVGSSRQPDGHSWVTIIDCYEVA